MDQTHIKSLSSRQSRLFEKWRKLHARILEQLKNGRFFELNRKKQHQILCRLYRYSQRLRRMGVAAKRLALGGLLAFMMTYATSAQAQTFVERFGTDNPFNDAALEVRPNCELADIDGDGDLDAFIGGYEGAILYLENTGTVNNPVFIGQGGAANPFDGVDGELYSVPSLVDLDGDGDLDAFIGDYTGIIRYFENTGSVENPVFTEQTGTNNPLDGYDVFNDASPDLIDIDGDGDYDAFIGNLLGTIRYFENTGTINNAVFFEQSGMNNPFDDLDVGGYSSPDFVDIDGDGDLDAFIGERYGTVRSFENIGSATSPVFMELIGMDAFFTGVDVGFHATPEFADIDGDGDVDALIGEFYSTIKYFENTEINSSIAQIGQEETGRLYPNPAKADLVFIETTLERSSELQLEVYDINGKLLLTQGRSVMPGGNTIELDVSALPQGCYLVQLKSEEQTSGWKLVIE
jgi:hypothetical protein